MILGQPQKGSPGFCNIRICTLFIDATVYCAYLEH